MIVNDRTDAVYFFSGNLVGDDYWSFLANASPSYSHCKNKLERSGNLKVFFKVSSLFEPTQWTHNLYHAFVG